MTERKIEAGDLQKALQTLQNLAKGHNSRGTATTEVVGMVAESGPTQVFHTPNSSDPKGWAGSSETEEDWSDSIGPDGTDYKAAGARIRKSILSKLAKGLPLTKGEVDFVSKGGMDKFDPKKLAAEKAEKAMAAEKAEKAMYKAKDEDEDEDEVEKAMDEDEDEGHEDEAEDKKMLRQMVKPSAMKKEVSKSLADYASEDANVRNGMEVSEFLAGVVSVMHKSLASMEARVTDRVLTAVARTAADQGEVSKSMAEALANLGEVLAAQAQRIEQVESGAARAPKSATLAKSVVGSVADDQPLNKSQVSSVLMDLVQKGQATAGDVLKFDATGELSPDLRAKVVGRR